MGRDRSTLVATLRGSARAALARLLGLVAVAAALLVMVAVAPAASAAASGLLTITTSGLPSGQRPVIVVSGPGFRRVVRSGHASLHGLRPGRYVLAISDVVVVRSTVRLRAGAVAYPARRLLSVQVRPGRTASERVFYAAVVNPGVRRLPDSLRGLVGDARDPSAILLPFRLRPPAIGTIFTSGPTAMLPAGLISKVTGTRRQGPDLVVSLVSVPVADAVPQLTFKGSLQLALATGAVQRAETSSRRVAHAAGSCVPPKLLRFAAHLDTVEVREAFIGAWPPQMKLTLAVRTTETLGVGLAAIGINCNWTLGELGPYSAAIPVGPVLIPVYATLPAKAGIHITGSLQAGEVHVASTTVAQADAGFDQNAASLGEQGTNVWVTGVLSLTGSAELSVSIGVQVGLGVAKAGNVHVEAGFGPEFDWSTGHDCELLLDLGSLSAGAEVFGHGLDTPSFTPFKLHLWKGCQPSTGGGGGLPGGGSGSGGGGSGSGGSGGGGSGEGTEATKEPGDAVASGGDTPCAVTGHGTVVCWGGGGAWLGNGTTTGPEACVNGSCSTRPVAVSGITNATAISTSLGANCALLATGQVDCWGDNSWGELGTGTTTTCYDTSSPCSVAPVEVAGLTGAIGVSTSDDHSCAVLATGQVKCWGQNGAGQLGNGESGPEVCGSAPCSTTPLDVIGVAHAVGVAAGFPSCALLGSGKVDCWDDFLGKSAVEMPGISTATEVAAGSDYACALLGGGGIDCWGENQSGQLGDGTTTESATPVAVSGITDAIAISAGEYHACALLATAQIDCWGENDAGEIGNGSSDGPSSCSFYSGGPQFACSTTPVRVTGISSATHVSAGRWNSCAVLASGQIDCWGSNGLGGLGHGTTTGPETCEDSNISYRSREPCSTIPVPVLGIP
jgi:alpha-tubulin suppressor-like RCC1 family protein